MTIPVVSKAWTVTPNKRRTYASLADQAGWWILSNHDAIRAKQTLKWSCDGTTGPTGAGDATNRITSVATASVQGANAASAQSWAVYTGADGVQTGIFYQGATADVIRIGYSRLGLYTLAGTTTNQPTASDEVSVSTATIVGTGTSLDRINQIWVRDDGRGWSCACFRSGVLQTLVGVEQLLSLATVRGVNPIYDVPYGLYRYTSVHRDTTTGAVIGGVSASASTTGGGMQIRCYTDSARTVAIGGGEITICATAGGGVPANGIFNAEKPAAQNGGSSPVFPIYWTGPRAANTDGFFASPIDWWQCYTNATTTPAAGTPFTGFASTDNPNTDTPRSNWVMALGSACLRPWNNAAATMEIS